MAEALVNVWETVWQMSLTGGFVCLAVCLLRLLLKRAPKVFSYALWALVFFRLICPVTLDSPMSVIPSRQQWQAWSEAVVQKVDPQEGKGYPSSAGQQGVSELSDPLRGDGENVRVEGNVSQMGQNGSLADGMVNSSVNTQDRLENTGSELLHVNLWENPSAMGDVTEREALAAMVWLAGMILLFIWQWIRAYRWKHSLGQIDPVEEGVYTASRAAAPFVMGLCHPAIYLPGQMTKEEREYVLLHERTHLRRKDYLIKMTAFGICCVHWFNPFAWLAFRLMCMDMEMSCDEAVLQQLNGHQKKAYATALLSFADRTVSGGSLAFGEPYAKKRIRNVLQYRRPSYRWMLVLTVVCLALAGCLLTDPVDGGEKEPNDIYEEGGEDNVITHSSEIETQEATERETNEYDVYFAHAEAHWNSFQAGKKGGQFTEESTSWHVDLNHDGEDERLVLDWGYMDPGSMGIFAVLNTDGTVLYVDTPGPAHMGWVSYYVCQWNDREYLLQYNPYLGTGGGSYSYVLYQWDSEPGVTADQHLYLSVVDQNTVDFYLGDGEELRQHHGDWEMDIAAMVDFANRVNFYLENSYLLFSTDQDWLGDAIDNSENGMFVLGSPEEPYRQYENYSMFARKPRPTEKAPDRDELTQMLTEWCQSEGVPFVDQEVKYEAELQALQDYIDSYQVGNSSPLITTESVSWEVDLTHDGQPEQVIFDWSQFGGGFVGMFAVLDGRGRVLYSDEVGSSHAGLRTYYLCSWEGKEYLFRYYPNMMQEEGSYWYELFYLTADGEKIIEDTERIGFSIAVLPSAPNNGGKRVMDIPVMVAFADKVNEYIQHSFLIVSSDWDWVRELWNTPGSDFVVGSPQKPYRMQETFWWFNATEDLLGLDLSTITDVGEKIKTWCEAAKIPYIE